MNEQQLSQILQQSMSPVHAAVQIPQAYQTAPPQNYLYGTPNVSMMGRPSAPPSPYYNPEYNMGLQVVNQARRAGAHMAMMQDIRQNTPGRWASDQGMNLSVDPMTKRIAAAEEVAVRDTSGLGFQGGFGLGSFQGVFNAASMATMATPMGLMSSLALGTGANMVGGMMDRAVFGQARDLRQAGMMLRSSLNVANMGTNFGMDASGVMRHDVSQDLTNQITRLSKTDTRFTGRQFLQMTDKMAQVGMLQGVGSTEQLVERVKKVSKQLKLFMKVANEPDVLAAIKQMGELRNIGVSEGQLTQATSNARAFARMAGISRQQMTTHGMQTANQYMQQGASGAAGYQVGILTRGMAAQSQNLFSRGLLANMGGADGVSNIMSQGILGAQRHTTMQMVMNSVFDSKGGGRFKLNTGVLNKILAGGDISDIYNQRTRGIKDINQHVQDMKERAPELQEAMQQGIGGSGMMLLTLRQAQALQKSTGGAMTLNTALQRVTGSEQSARALSRIATSPRAMGNLVQNLRQEQRRNMSARQDEIQYQASFTARATGAFRRATDFGFSRGVARFNAWRSQELRNQAMGIFGTDASADKLLDMSKEQYNRAAQAVASGNVGEGNPIDASTGKFSFWTNPMDSLLGDTAAKQAVRSITGYDFTGGRLLMGTATRTTNKAFLAANASDMARLTAGKTDSVKSATYQQVLRRQQETSRIAQMAFSGGKERSLSRALTAMDEGEASLFKGLKIGDAAKEAAREAGHAGLDETFNQQGRKGVFHDAAVDLETTKFRILKSLKDGGIDTAQIEKRFGTDAGRRYLAGLVRHRAATSTQSQFQRERAMYKEGFSPGGIDIEKSKTKLVGEMGEALGLRDILREKPVMELANVLGKSGAKSVGEMQWATKITQMHALYEKGEKDRAEQIRKGLFRGKTPEQKKRIREMIQRMEPSLAKLKNKRITQALTSEDFDGTAVSVTAQAAFKGIGTIQASALQKETLTNLYETYGVKAGSVDELMKKADDSRFIKGLISEGGQKAALGRQLQATRSGDKSKTDLVKFLSPGRKLKTGVSFTGGGGDAAGNLQMQIAKSLQQFAIKNSRDTAKFGQTVNAMSTLVAENLSGAVGDFKQAVDKFSLTIIKK